VSRLTIDESRRSLQSLAAAVGRYHSVVHGLAQSRTAHESMLGGVAVGVASAFLGITEMWAANDGPWVAPWRDSAKGKRSDGERGPWCAYFASGCHAEAVGRINSWLVAIDVDARYVLTSPTSGSTSSWWHKAVDDGCAITAAQLLAGEAKPQTGDAWIRNADRAEVYDGGRGNGGHTGLVTGSGSGVIWTIEGNTDARGQDSNGGGVYAKMIRLDDARLVGLVRPTMRLV